MPNANLVPLENVRRWPRGIDSNSSLQSTSNISSTTEEQNVLNKEINFQFTSGACTKCGNFGHLTWQCHTFSQKKKTKNVYISSNSSKEEINSLLKTNENVHTSWSITDSCISLESQKESFNERIQKLEQNSLQHPSSTFSPKEFVTFDDLENHPFIQQMKERIKLLDQKTSDQ
uniref:CCHC-type domain-containing protein n=1 Tax=Meloidogyne incognita TaxID=6306 RepID=A0A914NZK5_MELIC